MIAESGLQAASSITDEFRNEGIQMMIDGNNGKRAAVIEIQNLFPFIAAYL